MLNINDKLFNMFTLESSDLEMRNERLAGQGEEKHEAEAGGGLHLRRAGVFAFRPPISQLI